VRKLAVTPFAVLTLVVSISGFCRADLKAYLAKPEPAYTWGRIETNQDAALEKPDGVTIYNLQMTSQEWQGHKWEHRVTIFRPDNLEFPGHCLIYNTGGSGAGKRDLEMGAKLARLSGTTYAVVFGNPKQPLYGGLNEDALIVYTWQKYMTTGDGSWPLHFPMAKAVLKGMDTVQAFAKQQNWPSISGFTVTGASKRGWTTWLVGASGDKRVRAIAPMVIDVLNVVKQVRHQLDQWGKVSEQIDDYSGAGLLKIVETPQFAKLMEIEDPYSYRDQITMPKLLILGTNDRYWAQDALNLYWDDLKGPKWVLYTPNSGHGLEDRERVYNTLAAFTRMIAGGKKLPKMEWSFSEADATQRFTLKSSIKPKSARTFHVDSTTRDFRNGKWTSVEVEKAGGTTVFTHPAPATGYTAVFGEATYDLDGRPFTLSTQLRIVPAGK
jgi:PhoPQ-activated pathogenicity-related protein